MWSEDPEIYNMNKKHLLRQVSLKVKLLILFMWIGWSAILIGEIQSLKFKVNYIKIKNSLIGKCSEINN